MKNALFCYCNEIFVESRELTILYTDYDNDQAARKPSYVSLVKIISLFLRGEIDFQVLCTPEERVKLCVWQTLEKFSKMRPAIWILNDIHNK